MPIYDGVVTVGDNDIPVIVELDGQTVRLLASGTEVGRWRTDEVEIRHMADSTFSISAEDDTLTFVPSEPARFAAELNGHVADVTPPAPLLAGDEVVPSSPAPTEYQMVPPSPSPAESQVAPSAAGEPETPDVDSQEAPPAKPLTMGLFYALCVATSGLAIWALVSIIF